MPSTLEVPLLSSSASSSPNHPPVMATLLEDTKKVYRRQEETNQEGHHSLVSGEDTPAYSVLQKFGLLNTSFRKASFEEIFEPGVDLEPNATQSEIYDASFSWHWHHTCFLFGKLFKYVPVTVPPGHVVGLIDDNNDYLLAKPGSHLIKSPFIVRATGTMKVTQGNIIVHGNRTIVTVPQGELGYATDMGQPILLPPGLHSWKSETMRFEKLCKLDNHVIVVGPYTVLTVDEGYSAITQNNGRQVILDGGETHLLTHQKWRFEKFITKKIQTDDLEKIQAASADNVIMSVDSTVVWRIKDVRLAAVAAAETMSQEGRDANADIRKLRRDVLKQAIASLASFIGSVNYSDSFNVAAMAQRNVETAEAVPVGSSHVHSSESNPIFDVEGMSEAVTHAGQITSKFGVEIISINIISANPVDKNLTKSLATGAVASAEALQAETQARGLAKAAQIRVEAEAITRKIDSESQAASKLILAKAEADAEMLRAEGSKQAEILRAQGSKEAAALLETSKVAINLETLRMSASALKPSDKFFFGQEPAYMSNVVMKGPESSGVMGALADETL